MLQRRGIYFNRLGKLGLVASALRAYQVSQEANCIDTVNGVVAQFNAEPDIQAIMGSAYIGLLNAAGSNFGSTINNIAAQTVNRMVFRDNPQPNQTLVQLNVLASLQEIIRQMKLASASVLAMTITATAGTWIGTGDGSVLLSTKRALDGRVLENSFSESLTLFCTVDSYSGGAQAGNEAMVIQSPGKLLDPYAFDWPLGSGANTTLNVINGNADNSQGNLLVNSGFSDFTVANTPDNFTIVSGAAGVNIFQETSIVLDGSSSALRLLGNGTAIDIRQEFDSSSGSSAILNILTQLGCNIYMRRDGSAPAAGVLTIQLYDPDAAQIIADEAGVDNTFDIDLTALSVNYAAFKSAFRLPAILPDRIQLRIYTSTLLTSGRSVYLDKLGLGLMTQVYVSGPSVAVFSGASDFASGDYQFITINNSRGAAGTLDTFQTLMARLFPQMLTNELLLPSAAVPTISDSLIG